MKDEPIPSDLISILSVRQPGNMVNCQDLDTGIFRSTLLSIDSIKWDEGAWINSKTVQFKNIENSKENSITIEFPGIVPQSHVEYRIPILIKIASRFEEPIYIGKQSDILAFVDSRPERWVITICSTSYPFYYGSEFFGPIHQTFQNVLILPKNPF